MRVRSILRNCVRLPLLFRSLTSTCRKKNEVSAVTFLERSWFSWCVEQVMVMRKCVSDFVLLQIASPFLHPHRFHTRRSCNLCPQSPSWGFSLLLFSIDPPHPPSLSLQNRRFNPFSTWLFQFSVCAVFQF